MNDIVAMCSYIKITIILIVLTYATVLDIKYRETPLKIWLSSIPIITLLTIFEYIEGIEYNLIITLYSCIISIAIPWIIYLSGLLGGADALAYTLVTLGAPFRPLPMMTNVVPFPFLVLVYSNILPAIMAIILLVYNLILNRHFIPKGVSLKTKMLLLVNGIPIKVSRYLRQKYTYPLQIFEEDHELVVKYRSAFNIDEDPEEHRAKIRKLLERGLISSDSYIWVAYGLPYILFILIGYITSLIIADYPILAIITKFLRES